VRPYSYELGEDDKIAYVRQQTFCVSGSIFDHPGPAQDIFDACMKTTQPIVKGESLSPLWFASVADFVLFGRHAQATGPIGNQGWNGKVQYVFKLWK
jgi:hypothetical protein